MILIFDTPEEKDKFTILYETYGKTIYYTLCRFELDEYIIEDLSQEIFLIIAKHINDVDLDDYIRTRNYIITITRNYCKNYLRNLNRKKNEPIEDYPNLQAEDDDILDKLITKEKIAFLSKEIDNLDDIYKMVLELKYVNEFSNEEIASILKIKKKTVEMRLYRANKILRAKVEEIENEE